MGVFLCGATLRSFLKSSPHMCGGVSQIGGFTKHTSGFSPHVWGCFHVPRGGDRPTIVLPTCVGVFPLKWAVMQIQWSSPHMCGGVSYGRSGDRTLPKFSPHVWGCFFNSALNSIHTYVLPTCVGVFLMIAPDGRHPYCSPHMCGGVSDGVSGSELQVQFSPHVWGCFFTATGNFS